MSICPCPKYDLIACDHFLGNPWASSWLPEIALQLMPPSLVHGDDPTECSLFRLHVASRPQLRTDALGIQQRMVRRVLTVGRHRTRPADAHRSVDSGTR